MSRRTLKDEINLEAAGYVSPRHRAGCQKCAHASMFLCARKGTEYVRKDIWCAKHKACVACGGWCPAHAPVALVRKAA